MHGPKIITLDIETAPIKAHVWGAGARPQFIALNQVDTDWTILSYCVKTLGKRGVVYSDNREQENPRDDSKLLQELWEILDATDIIIAQNGLRFDMKKINARLVQEGYPPPRPYKVIDTLIESRKIAAFTSHKLEWMSQILTDTPKSKHSKFPGMELWTECLAHNLDAWNEMKKYNPTDVISTEKVYLRLRPWIIGHPNVAQYYSDEARRCPRCGSTKLTLQDKPVYTQTGEYDHYRCDCCGGFARGRYTRNSTAKRRNLLTN